MKGIRMTETIDDILASVDAAPTAGRALDAIPDGWRIFISGPELDGYASSMLPPGVLGAPRRIYDRGLAMGRGPTRLEAMQAAAAWLRERVPADARRAAAA